MNKEIHELRVAILKIIDEVYATFLTCSIYGKKNADALEAIRKIGEEAMTKSRQA